MVVLVLIYKDLNVYSYKTWTHKESQYTNLMTMNHL
jgi:hypothetical protein